MCRQFLLCAQECITLLKLADAFPITANFDDPNDFEGWNCGKITACGKYGNICGGYDVKTGGDYIQQTFMLPAGRPHWVTLDFIKIDSW